ncbi:uncharacterized protein RJT21DRAFT_120579 [Scheffersomyces amazonensis]|uniref:uncharacterized protein n=1 Tax=Scheffersomyces amazonensis TaxID=1078765 RepID=UPI00315CD6C9
MDMFDSALKNPAPPNKSPSQITSNQSSPAKATSVSPPKSMVSILSTSPSSSSSSSPSSSSSTNSNNNNPNNNNNNNTNTNTLPSISKITQGNFTIKMSPYSKASRTSPSQSSAPLVSHSDTHSNINHHHNHHHRVGKPEFESNIKSRNANKKNSRRKHRNSHLGCGTCKKRRIKCDETLPACMNCTKGKLHCAYLTLDTNARNALRMAQYNQTLRQEKVESGPTAMANSDSTVTQTIVKSEKDSPAKSQNTNSKSKSNSRSIDTPTTVPAATPHFPSSLPPTSTQQVNSVPVSVPVQGPGIPTQPNGVVLPGPTYSIIQTVAPPSMPGTVNTTPTMTANGHVLQQPPYGQLVALQPGPVYYTTGNSLQPQTFQLVQTTAPNGVPQMVPISVVGQQTVLQPPTQQLTVVPPPPPAPLVAPAQTIPKKDEVLPSITVKAPSTVVLPIRSTTTSYTDLKSISLEKSPLMATSIYPTTSTSDYSSRNFNTNSEVKLPSIKSLSGEYAAGINSTIPSVGSSHNSESTNQDKVPTISKLLS